jgi:hypothetical protein
MGNGKLGSRLLYANFRIAHHPIHMHTQASYVLDDAECEQNVLGAPAAHFDRRGDEMDPDATRLRFWIRLRRTPTPVKAHSRGPVGSPDSA